MTPTYSPTATERVLPRLALDFTTGVLDPRVTVARALNTATRVNSSGFIETVNANLPRFDYDPATLAPKGLLIEESRANLLLYSNTFTDPVWTVNKGGAGSLPVVTAASGASPDGTNNAYRVQFNAGGSTSADFSLIQQAVTGLANPHTGMRSIWMKSYDGSTYQIALRSLGALTYTVFSVGPTWTRVSHTDTSSTTNDGLQLIVRGTYGTSTTADILVYGAQFELGAFATSYIPTTTTSLTRNADVVTMTGTNFSDWYNASEGTFVAHATVPSAGGTTRRILSINDTTVNESIQLCILSTSNGGYFEMRDGGAIQVSTTNGTFAVGASTGYAFAYKLNDCAVSANAAAVTTDATATIPIVTQVNIGAHIGTYLNGTVSRIEYYPQRVINAETQAFSK